MTQDNSIEEFTQLEIELLSAFARWREAVSEVDAARQAWEGYSFDYHNRELIKAADDAEQRCTEIARRKAEILVAAARNRGTP